ncbi:MAG: glycosyltransferase [Ignavibacteriales bacterium]|nr:glycosyltransferase [Ignavibacteriales bacterium]
MTLITIILPIYNAWPFLPEAMDSLLNQTLKDIKILAIDDGSTDECTKYLSELNDPRIKIITKANKGLVETLNFGLELVDTPYLARMDADDICEENRFERQLQFLQGNKEYILCGSSVKYFGKIKNNYWRINMPQKHEDIMSAMLNRRSAIIHPTIMVRTKVMKEIGGYRNRFFPAEDYDLFLRLGKKGKLANLSEHLLFYRVSGKSIFASNIYVSLKKYDEARLLYFNREKKKIKNLLKKFTRKVDSFSVYVYRKGVDKYVNTSKFLGYSYFFFAAIMNPSRVFLFLKRKFTRKS